MLASQRLRRLVGGTALVAALGLSGCAYDPYYDNGYYGGGGGYGGYGDAYSYAPGSGYYYDPGPGYYTYPSTNFYYYQGRRYDRRDHDHDRDRWRDRDHDRDRWRGDRSDWRGRDRDRRSDRGGWDRNRGGDWQRMGPVRSPSDPRGTPIYNPRTGQTAVVPPVVAPGP